MTSFQKMFTCILSTAISVVLCVCACQSWAVANLIQNPGFETATTQGVGVAEGSELGSSHYTSANGGFGQVNSSGVSNWSASDDRVWYMTDLGGGAADFPDGNYAVRLDADGEFGGIEILSQSGLNLSAGAPYEFQIDVWGESSTGLFNARLTGPEMISLFSGQAIPIDAAFDTLTTVFSPTISGNFTLELFSSDNSPNHVWVDNVSVSLIREPSTFVLGAPGLLALGFVGRRRRRRFQI